jgi:alkylation response protein AidB-like acyl-CoA dehydrogenase
VSRPGVQWLLADMAKDIEAARLQVHSAVVRIDRGEDATMACSMAECLAGDMAVARAGNAVPVFGGSGYTRGFEVERLYRDAEITQICEGTNQIHRMIIARELIRNGAAARADRSRSLPGRAGGSGSVPRRRWRGRASPSR